MKSRAENGGHSSARRISHRSLVGIVALAVLLIGVVTALSMQIIQKQRTAVVDTPAENLAQAARPASRNYVTANAFGQPVVATGRRASFGRLRRTNPPDWPRGSSR